MTPSRPLLSSLISFLVLLLSCASAAAATHSCLACHGSLPNPLLGAYHAEWKKSVHARRLISCEECHGGNAREADKTKAHLGVFSAMDPKSTVYYTKVPALCGECHKRELSDFQASKHYATLMEKGIGPSCITCHDAMSTKILNPDAVETFCTVCHNAKNKNLPEVSGMAREVLKQMARIDRMITLAETELAEAARQGVNVQKSQGFMNLARREFQACTGHWHTFQLASMRTFLEGVEVLIQRGRDALRHVPGKSP